MWFLKKSLVLWGQYNLKELLFHGKVCSTGGMIFVFSLRITGRGLITSFALFFVCLFCEVASFFKITLKSANKLQAQYSLSHPYWTEPHKVSSPASHSKQQWTHTKLFTVHPFWHWRPLKTRLLLFPNTIGNLHPKLIGSQQRRKTFIYY